MQGVFIGSQHTDALNSNDQRAKHADPEASLRENLAGQLEAGQADLSASIIELRNSPNADAALIAQGDQQLALLLSLRSQLATASPKQLATMGAQIAIAVSVAASTAHQAQQASSSGGGPATASVASASRAAREAVDDFQDAYFKKRKFDAFLQFNSAEDEREFRQREAEHQQEIAKALALHTPQGDLLAAQLAKEQLQDAGAHGAARSPAYAPLMAKIESAEGGLKAALDAKAPKEAASERLALAQSPSAGDEVADIPAEVLASFRKMKAPDQDSAGHGLGTKLAVEQGERSQPIR